MRKVILACNTIANELNQAMEQAGVNHPILWIESGLHDFPQKLKARLQEELDALTDVDWVLLAFGFCGNAVLGLKTGNFHLVIPRADDCISLLIGSEQERRKISSANGTYFLTKGWVDNERNIWKEYKTTVDKYGKERADGLSKSMLRHYRHLGIIDTGAYDLQEFLNTSHLIARDLDLEHVIIPGTTKYFCKLLTGPYDEDFIVIAPHSEVNFMDLHVHQQRT